MSEQYSSSNRPVWLAIILIVAVLVAAGTAVLLHLAGTNETGALAGAGTAFAATMTLSMAVWNFING